MKIIVELPNGDVLTTAPDRLQLAPSKDGKNVILVACNHPIAAFSGQLIPVVAEPHLAPAE